MKTYVLIGDGEQLGELCDLLHLWGEVQADLPEEPVHDGRQPLAQCRHHALPPLQAGQGVQLLFKGTV